MFTTFKPILLNFGCCNTNFPFIEETFDNLTMYKITTLCKQYV